MRRPDLPTYLFGNPLSALVLVIAAIVMAFKWWTGTAPSYLTLAVIFTASYSSSAYDRLQKYVFWRREWNAMNGGRTGFTLPKLQALRIFGGVTVWFFGAHFALTEGHDPVLRWIVGMFWLGSVAMAAYGIYLLIRSIRRRRAARGIPVQVSVGMPLRSPSAAQALQAVPEYCWPLFAR